MQRSVSLFEYVTAHESVIELIRLCGGPTRLMRLPQEWVFHRNYRTPRWAIQLARLHDAKLFCRAGLVQVFELLAADPAALQAIVTTMHITNHVQGPDLARVLQTFMEERK